VGTIGQAGYTMGDLGVVAAGVPNQTYSQADCSNGQYGPVSGLAIYRDWGLPTRARGPVEHDTLAEKRRHDRVTLHDCMAINLTLSVLHAQEQGHEFTFMTENPTGGSRCREFMNTNEWTGACTGTTVQFCAYRNEAEKPNDWWRNMDKWHPKGNTRNG
jgi:hypothetical protein